MASSSKISESNMQVITVTKETSLGLSLVGEISRTEGPLIYIKDIIPGGDCHKDGRLRPGDQLVCINKDSLVGVSCEEARSILNRAKLSLNRAHVQESSRKKLSTVNPDARFKVEKLEMALKYLGISPTEEQRQSLRQSIHMDTNKTVSFGEFVKVAKSLFNLQLKEDVLKQRIADNDVANLLDSVTSQVPLCELSESNDIERLKRERREAHEDIRNLQERLLESEKQNQHLSEELKYVKQEAKAAIEETRSLRSRIQLAEAVQKQARAVEMDYEEVIRLLEAELTELKSQLSGHSSQNKDNTQDFKRRITVLGCQLRKSEMARKTYEATTEKLLNFVEDVNEKLSDNTGSVLNLSERIPALSSQSFLSKVGPNGRAIVANIAAESKELSRSVRSILEADCLPYGWEEAYTADGIKYFINHVTQTTSWTHPVADALGLSYQEDIGEGILHDPPELKNV
ncbi:syntaxin-binding protein 4 [Bombina bombina]|uniref:syntaxin-binding protein 4 n=1 Tax=Bombina bombina TaxID=8345 RepID=UPI00235AE619|nr:syntaxin-binding protein 4 [Bombina bombina]